MDYVSSIDLASDMITRSLYVYRGTLLQYLFSSQGVFLLFRHGNISDSSAKPVVPIFDTGIFDREDKMKTEERGKKLWLRKFQILAECLNDRGVCFETAVTYSPSGM